MELSPVKPTSLKEIITSPRWLSMPNSRLVINPVQIAEDPVAEQAAQSLAVNLAYYVGERPVRLPSFLGWQLEGGSGLRVTQMSWAPHEILVEAESDAPAAEFDVSTTLADDSTVAQRLRVQEISSDKLYLVGQFPAERIRWDDAHEALILQHERFHVVVSINRRVRFVPTADERLWMLEVSDVKAGDEIVVAAGFAPAPSIAGHTIAFAKRASSARAFKEALRRREVDWDTLLTLAPQPMDFELHFLDRPEATPERNRNSYYRAWVFLLCDTLPPMVENDYPYPQVACGKPSLWDEGHPKARPSCQWESFIAMQFLAEIEPDAMWSAFEGMMSLVDEEGTLGGEGLPSRHVQTAWILYQATKDRARLEGVYPAMKRMLLWKASDPRWIFKGERPENQRDSEFVVHALMDMLFAQKICRALEMPQEVHFWQKQIDDLRQKYRRWFWETRGGTAYWLYREDIDLREEPDHSWCLQGLSLPPEILEEPERESLMKLLRSHFKDEIPFLIHFLNKHPTFNFVMRGAWQYGTPEEVARMAEAAMSAVSMAGDYAECYTDEFPVGLVGVAPSVFGAANAIDTTLWHNGMMLGDGLPVIVRLPNAQGVLNFRLRGETMDVVFDRTGDGLEITGNALAFLRMPEGFAPGVCGDGSKCWRGKLAVGEQLVLEEADSA